MCKLRIRDLREDHDMNQTEVANILGTNQKVYSRYETGVNEIPVRHIITLANYYNVSADYILGKTKDPTPPSEKKEPPKKEYSPTTIKAAEAIRAIFLEKKGREPNQEELLILKKFIETFIEGMKK